MHLLEASAAVGVTSPSTQSINATHHLLLPVQATPLAAGVGLAAAAFISREVVKQYIRFRAAPAAARAYYKVIAWAVSLVGVFSSGRIQMSTDEYVGQQGWSCTKQLCVSLHLRTAVVTPAVTGASLHIPDLRVVLPLPTACHRH